MFHEVTILGNVGSNPELRYTPSGDSVCSFSIAANRKWTGKDGQPGEETIWFRISVWGKMGEACNQYLSKGQQCFIKGQLSPDKETGGPRLWAGQDGQQRASYEIKAMTVKFLGGGKGHAEGSSNGDVSRRESVAEPLTDDDIPF